MAGHEHVVGAPWVRNKQTMLNMAGNICDHCDEKIFPPRDICPNCGDDQLSPYVFGRPRLSSSKLPLYTSDSCKGEQEKLLQMQEL